MLSQISFSTHLEIIVLGTFITLIIGAIQKILFVAKFIVRIHSTFRAGDLGTEVDFLYAMMWVTKVIFQTIPNLTLPCTVSHMSG